jgi:hypothetical protein
MKKLLLAVCVLALTVPALAKDPGVVDGSTTRVACDDFVTECWVWDGTQTYEPCDSGGTPVWRYGTPYGIPMTDCYGDPIGEVLATVLQGDYLDDVGERAILGSFDVTADCYLVEICHYYDIENSYDGGNVEVHDGTGWVVVDPVGGYPDTELSDSDYYYAWCVDGQPGFTDDVPIFVADCFDLSAYVGSTVQIAVKFGSDSSVTYPGWYISSVKAGAPSSTPTLDRTWGAIKSMY